MTSNETLYILSQKNKIGG